MASWLPLVFSRGSCEREPALPVATNQHRRTEELQWKHLPNTVLTSNEGGKGRVVNLLVKQCRKCHMIAKQKQMANMADSSAHGKANPCGHPACRFLGKTARRIHSGLTLAILHLATCIMYWYCGYHFHKWGQALCSRALSQMNGEIKQHPYKEKGGACLLLLRKIN